MNEENRNLLIALFLCLIVLMGWPYIAPQSNDEANKTSSKKEASTTLEDNFSPQTPFSSESSESAEQEKVASYKNAPRLMIQTPNLVGSFSLLGARLDDISLTQYHADTSAKSPMVRLFLPLKKRMPHHLLPSVQEKVGPYFSEFGWLPAEGHQLKLPNQDTLWSLDEEKMRTVGKVHALYDISGAIKDVALDSTHPVYLIWDNGEGLVFHRRLSVDDHYLFTIQDTVDNLGKENVELYAYGLIVRQLQKDEGSYILYEGLIGAFKENGLREIKYNALVKEGQETFRDTQGWLGITDKYWASALIPPQNQPMVAQFKSRPDTEVVQADYISEPLALAPGSSLTFKHRLFTGAKIVSVINTYQEMGIYRFDLMIDWGWLSFLTKPMFYALDFIGSIVKNFGLAILVITVLVKLAFYPLANKSYKSMSKMRALQTEVERIRTIHKGDVVKQQHEIMALYRRENVSPLSGCLPLFIQLPVFFALYKVLYGTIEMRHAPFFGWIRDLSAPDPTSIFNLFGLIPWTPPSYFIIGAWPILMGLSMFVQQRLTPAPQDPTQQKLFMLLPFVFTIMLAHFPAGLVIYWTWNNVLSILQQLILMLQQHPLPQKISSSSITSPKIRKK